MEKQGDQRVLFLVLFAILVFGIVSLFVARQNLKQQSNQTTSSATQVSRATQASRSGDSGTDYGPYMDVLQKRIKHSWFPPKNTESLRGMVIFKVHSNGSVSNLRMLKTTNLAIADQAMMNAVEGAAPFAPLPSGSPENVDIEFSFDYNVFHPVSREKPAVEGEAPKAKSHTNGRRSTASPVE